MAGLHKAVGVALVSLSLLFGTDYSGKKESSRPDTKVDNTTYRGQITLLSQGVRAGKKGTCEDQLNQLAERVLSLSSYLFLAPCDTYKGVICIRKTRKNANRYVVIDGWKENEWRRKRLNLGVYTGLNAEVDEYLLSEDYRSAAEALSKSSLRMIGFYDLDADGLTTNIGDVLVMRDEEDGQFKVERPTWLPEAVSTRVNDAYRFVLETVEPILEEEWKARKDKGPDKKRGEEETREQRMMRNLTELTGYEF